MKKVLKEDLTLRSSDQPLGDNKSQWMTSLHNYGLLKNIRLLDMLLPGSHDSAAVAMDGDKHCGSFWLSNDMANKVAKNQDMSIWDQLQNGIRFLDIRVIESTSFHGWEYPLHHTYLVDSSQTNTLYDAFDVVQNFLNQNPSETVVIRVDGNNGCRVGERSEHENRWISNIDSRSQFLLMKDKSTIQMFMTSLQGKAIVDIRSSGASHEAWPGQGFGIEGAYFSDSEGPFEYGEFYKNLDGLADK